jgi:putative transposase
VSRPRTERGRPIKTPTVLKRRSIRLKGYDYAQPGAYFVTICVRDRACLLGEVVDGDVVFSHIGEIAHETWADVPGHFPNVSIDTFVVMPNHVHGIISIDDDPCRGGVTPPLHDELHIVRPTVTPPLREEPHIARPTATPPLHEELHIVRPTVTPPLHEELHIARPTATPSLREEPHIVRPTLGQIVAYYKYRGTKRINALQGTPGIPFWQRGYYEHVIRDDAELERVREYILYNPLNWATDEDHPNR